MAEPANAEALQQQLAAAIREVAALAARVAALEDKACASAGGGAPEMPYLQLHTAFNLPQPPAFRRVSSVPSGLHGDGQRASAAGRLAAANGGGSAGAGEPPGAAAAGGNGCVNGAAPALEIDRGYSAALEDLEIPMVCEAVLGGRGYLAG